MTTAGLRPESGGGVGPEKIDELNDWVADQLKRTYRPGARSRLPGAVATGPAGINRAGCVRSTS
jgi:hypothetical protein